MHPVCVEVGLASLHVLSHQALRPRTDLASHAGRAYWQSIQALTARPCGAVGARIMRAARAGVGGRGRTCRAGQSGRGAAAMREVVIVEAVRTPVGRRGGALKDVHPVVLAAMALRELVRPTSIEPAAAQSVRMS